MNQYEKERTPKQKKFDKIMVILVLILMCSLIVWIVFGTTDNTRTHYDRAQTDTHEISYAPTGEKCEAFDLYNEISDKTLVYDNSFKETYPLISAAIADVDFCSSEIDLKVNDNGGYLCVMDGYVTSYDYAVRGLDILLIPYSINVDGERSYVRVNAPVRYSITLDTSLATVKYAKLDEKNYRLNFYTMDITFLTNGNLDLCTANYELGLNSIMTEEKTKDENYAKLLVLTGSDGSRIAIDSEDDQGVVNGSAPISASSSGELKLTIEFNDTLYNTYDYLEYTIDSKGATPSDTKFIVGIN